MVGNCDSIEGLLLKKKVMHRWFEECTIAQCHREQHPN
jgi:hypothetical protein